MDWLSLNPAQDFFDKIKNGTLTKEEEDELLEILGAYPLIYKPGGSLKDILQSVSRVKVSIEDEAVNTTLDLQVHVVHQHFMHKISKVIVDRMFDNVSQNSPIDDECREILNAALASDEFTEDFKGLIRDFLDAGEA